MFLDSGILGIIVFFVFVIVIGGIVVNLCRGVSQRNRNNHSPRLTVEAFVVSKRMDVSHHQHANAGDPTGAHGYHTTTSTSYYATFQVQSGDRMEFSVNGREYGLLAEGDSGKLTFQGTRYIGFQR